MQVLLADANFRGAKCPGLTSLIGKFAVHRLRWQFRRVLLLVANLLSKVSFLIFQLFSKFQPF